MKQNTKNKVWVGVGSTYPNPNEIEMKEYCQADVEAIETISKHIMDNSYRSRFETFLHMLGIKAAKRSFLRLGGDKRK